MKVVGIFGGLGSQMFKYAFYLKLKEICEDEIYATMIPLSFYSGWNGYELDRVFGVDMLKLEDISKIVRKKYDSYEICIMRSMENHCKEQVYHLWRGECSRFQEPHLYYLNMISRKILKKIGIKDKKIKECHVDVYQKDFQMSKDHIFIDEFNHTSDEYIKSSSYDLKKIFKFPSIEDDRNFELSKMLQDTDSVALHVRRSDHMYDNGALFEKDYFKKAVLYIKKNVENPIFCVFSEEQKWCKDNIDVLGIDKKKDRVIFVDWNIEKESYRDMQLMTFCKHNILAISSFSWWGYYLSDRKEKIVCAPKGYWFEVQHHF